ncbi:MAG: hypothetical protein KJ718_02590 [Nanoarchaeota archaeon]|nr:hypothetical protein [Nanoarchaeota archaeon]
MRKQLDGLKQLVVTLGAVALTGFLCTFTVLSVDYSRRKNVSADHSISRPSSIVSGKVIAEIPFHSAQGPFGNSSPYIFSLRTGAGTETILLTSHSAKADSMIEPGFSVSVNVDDSFTQYRYAKHGEYHVNFESITGIFDRGGNRIK